MPGSENGLAKREVLRVLHRVGHSREEIEALDKLLPDHLELRHYETLLAEHGVECERLVEEMDGGP